MLVKNVFLVYTEECQFIAKCLNLLPETSPKVLLAWEKGGLLTPAWNEDGSINRMWINVCGHMAAGALLANAIDPKVAEPFLVHDAYKRIEQERIAHARHRELDPSEENARAETESRIFLKNIGFSDDTVQAAQTTGDRGVDLILNGQSLPEGEIVFYVDCCTSGSKIVTPRRRFEDLLPEFKPGGRYAHVNEAYLKKYGKTHWDLWMGELIPILEKKIGQFLGYPWNCADQESVLNHLPDFVRG